MRQKIFLVSFILWVGLICMVQADEVINIDINGYGDDTAYSGTAVVDDGINAWQAYYGGWGLPMGSPRSADLTTSYDPEEPAGTYAAQTWIGDAGAGHSYESGSGLMDDGFIKDPLEVEDPNILLFGTGAYSGTFDIYVYGREAGSFSIISEGINDTKTVSGSVDPGQFVEGGNYVVFTDVLIQDPNNSVMITYSNTLNGLQLVKVKSPVAVSDGTVIDAREYDVAYDTNARDGEITPYGPDLGSYVHYLDSQEYMEYDITVDGANKGQYNVSADVVTRWGTADMTLYIDGILQGTLEYEQTSDDTINETNALIVNLFEGDHVIKWAVETGNLYFDVATLNFAYIGDIVLNDCADVYTYGLNLAGDINKDCRVNIADLALLAADWTANNDPEAP